jgi:hypothetical protein
LLQMGHAQGRIVTRTHAELPGGGACVLCH